jgi:hypothetical protein
MSKLMANMSEMGDRSNSDNRCRNTRGSNSGRAIKSTGKALSIRVKSRSWLSFFLSFNSKIPPVIMYADLVGSTNTSMTLPVEKMVTIIPAFTYEFSSIIRVMEASY